MTAFSLRLVVQASNVRCGSKVASAFSSRRKGPPARDAATDAKRKALVERMKAGAASAAKIQPQGGSHRMIHRLQLRRTKTRALKWSVLDANDRVLVQASTIPIIDACLALIAAGADADDRAEFYRPGRATFDIAAPRLGEVRDPRSGPNAARRPALGAGAIRVAAGACRSPGPDPASAFPTSRPVPYAARPAPRRLIAKTGEVNVPH